MPDDQNPASSQFAPLPDEKKSGGGQPLAKIQTRQIAISKADIEKFGIAEEFVRKNPALVELILQTESMKDEERKYWFQLLPIMSAEQVTKLQGILQNEKDQLAELDAKYAKEVAKLNEKHAPTWTATEARTKRKKIEESEQQHEAQEKGEEANILDQLENL